MRTRTWMLSGIAAAFALACGGGGDGDGGGGSGSLSGSDKGQIELEYNGQIMNTGAPDQVLFNTGEALVGQTITEVVTIRNVGNGPLTINVGFDYNIPPVVEDEGRDAPALQLLAVRVGGADHAVTTTETDNGIAQRAEGVVIGPVSDGGASVQIEVQFRRYADTNTRQASLVIASDTQSSAEQVVSMTVLNGSSFPVAQVDPTTLDFQQVNAGESVPRQIQVSNTGSDDLIIESVLFSGHPDFRFTWEGNETPYEPNPTEPIYFNGGDGFVIPPNAVRQFTVTFAPEAASPADGQIIFTTNDPVNLQVPVKLQGNTEGPAIEVNPKKVQFGGKLVGAKAQLPVEVLSTGTAPLVITGIRFTEDSNANFTLDFSSLPGFEENPEGPSNENPLTIDINGSTTFNVVYVPSVESPFDENGQPILDLGSLVVTSNAFDAEYPVEVSGLGVTQECPTAVGVIQEGEQVIPQTNLHLFGDQSFAPAGAVASWLWEAQQPSGSASVFVPSANFPNPTFEVNTAGEYLFRLTVWDETGVESCVPWETKVLVIPDEAIHVELLWDTPNDFDQTDEGPEAGSDVDLHFVHDAYAASGPDLDKDGQPDVWFNQPFDCFWFNAHPNWGSFDPNQDDDPGLDRDDTDGAGPENLNLNLPETTTYRVGVHYWSDHEYGKSLVTVRVYIHSNLVAEFKDVELVNHDMWDVATIDWPSGKVTQVTDSTGEYKITPNYQNPFFFQP